MSNSKQTITKEDYNQAFDRLEDIFDAKPNTKEGEELESLAILVEAYEDQNFPLKPRNQSK